MSQGYPALTVGEDILVTKIRSLPAGAEVMVTKGERVGPATVIGNILVPGRQHLVAASKQLNILPQHLPGAMVKGLGEPVEQGDVIACHSAPLGLFKKVCMSPSRGVVEEVSKTGQVTIREHAELEAVKAYLSGVVTQINPGEGVAIQTPAALVQGIFGIGGEGCGKLRMAVKKPTDTLGARQIKDQDRGCILVGGALVTADALLRAEELGVIGIISGGVLDKDLYDSLGYGIGENNGQADMGLSLVVTEGFGKIPMAPRTFQLLQKLAGQIASISSGSRGEKPEVIVPRDGLIAVDAASAAPGLEIGTRVRIVKEPWFCRLGKVIKLPVPLQKIESEARVRVLEVKLEDGEIVTVPRANVEIAGTVLFVPNSSMGLSP